MILKGKQRDFTKEVEGSNGRKGVLTLTKGVQRGYKGGARNKCTGHAPVVHQPSYNIAQDTVNKVLS